MCDAPPEAATPDEPVGAIYLLVWRCARGHRNRTTAKMVVYVEQPRAHEQAIQTVPIPEAQA